MTRPPPSHEAEILRAIAGGVAYTALVNLGPWTVEDVDLTLARHNLTVTDGGTVVRAAAPIPTLAQLMDNSPSPRVRQAAARAHTALVALEGVLAREYAGRAVEKVRTEQRAAVGEWIGLLRRLTHEAELEWQRLQGPSAKPRPARRAG